MRTSGEKVGISDEANLFNRLHILI